MSSRQCCIPECFSVNATASLCRVPAKRFCSGEKYKWAENLQRVILGVRDDHYIKSMYKRDSVRICLRHFGGEDILKKGSRIELKLGALPRLNMPIKSVSTTKSTGRPPRKRKLKSPSYNIPSPRKIKSPSYHLKLDDVKKSAVQYLPEGWLLQIEEDNVWFSLKPACFGELSPITICVNKSLGIWAAYYGWATTTTSSIFLQNVDLKKSTLLDTLNRFANAVICDGISLQGTEAEGFDDSISIHQKSVMSHPKGGPPLQQRIAVRSNNCDIFLSSGKMCCNCKQRQRQLQRNRLQKATYHDRVGKMPLARAHTAIRNSRKIAAIRSQQEELKELKRQVKGLLRDREAFVTIGSEVTRDLRSVMANGIKQQPFEIWENRTNADNSKTGSGESANEKAKFLTMDESELSWTCGQQNSRPTEVPAPPITSVPKVVVNLVQGYGPHQPVVKNTWTGSGTPQQWAQVQIEKGRLATNGVIPITQQVKQEISETLTPFVQLPTSDVSSQNSFKSAPGVEENSQKSYATSAFVSLDFQESETINNGDASSAEIATPVPATPSESNQIIQESLLPIGITSQSPAVIPAPTLNLDSRQFTQINTDAQQHRASDVPSATTREFIQPIAMTNHLQFVGDDKQCDTVLMQSEVDQLRIQQQQQSGENGESPSQGDAMQAILATSKRKRKASTSTGVAKSEYGTGDTLELHAHSSNIRKSRSLADRVLVTITPEHMEYLYQKYPEIKQEPPIRGTCDVMQLLQQGKAGQRKSLEQNALNNNIRTILDTTGIVESGDTRVQDAVCLIMDRFTVLQEHMNDAYVRQQLTIKVKRSLHCKKWRLKRHKIKQLEMSSSSSPDAQAWMLDPNTSNISVSSNNSLLNDDTFSEIRKTVGSNNSLLSQENLSEMRKVVSPNNSLLNDESS